MKIKHKKLLLAILAVATIFSLLAVSASAYQVSTYFAGSPDMTSGYWTSALIPIADVYTSVLNQAGERALTQSYNVPNDYLLQSKSFFTLNAQLGRGLETLSSFNNSYGVYSFVLFDSYDNTWGVPLDGFPLEFSFYADSITYGFGSPPDYHNTNVAFQFGDFVTTQELLDEILTANVVALDTNVPPLEGSYSITYYNIDENVWKTVDTGYSLSFDATVVQSWYSPWGVTYDEAYVTTYNLGNVVANNIDSLVRDGEIDGTGTPVLISDLNVYTDYTMGDNYVLFTSLTNTFIRSNQGSLQTDIIKGSNTVRQMITPILYDYANLWYDDPPPPPSIDEVDLSAVGNMLGTAVDGFFDVEILPNLTIRLLFGSIIGILVFVAFLRYFAGG